MSTRTGNDVVSSAFKDLKSNQRMSIINLLMIIAVCDEEEETVSDSGDDIELQTVNNYISILQIKYNAYRVLYQ